MAVAIAATRERREGETRCAVTPETVKKLIGLGATELAAPRHEPYGSIVNLADPDGNAVDLCAYR